MSATRHATTTSTPAALAGSTVIVLKLEVGIRDTVSAPMNSVHTATTAVFDHHPAPHSCCAARGTSTSNAPAGAGTPTKKSLVYAGAVGSAARVLNRASRSTIATTYTSTTAQPAGEPSRQVKYRISAGVTPKLIASARESSSAPILVDAPSRRATRPSRPSSTAATTTSRIDRSILPSAANRTPVRPAHSAATVRTDGSIITPTGRCPSASRSFVGAVTGGRRGGRRCPGSAAGGRSPSRRPRRADRSTPRARCPPGSRCPRGSRTG